MMPVNLCPTHRSVMCASVNEASLNKMFMDRLGDNICANWQLFFFFFCIGNKLFLRVA